MYACGNWYEMAHVITMIYMHVGRVEITCYSDDMMLILVMYAVTLELCMMSRLPDLIRFIYF